MGCFDDAAGNLHGFLRDHRGRFTVVDALGTEYGTQPARINDRGDLAGAFIHADGSSSGFHRSRHGRFTTIEAPGQATYTPRSGLQRPRRHRRR